MPSKTPFTSLSKTICLFLTVFVHRMEMTDSVGLVHTNEILVMKYTYKGALVLV